MAYIIPRRAKYLKEQQLFTFGEFSLNVDDRSLHQSGVSVALTPKMFDLLLVLVQNQGRVVEKEFLLTKIWPDSFVEEGSITYNIRQLRKALGDEFQAPVYIETIPRRGYRFVAEVSEGPAASEIEEAPAFAADQTPETEGKRIRPLLLVALTAFGVLFGGIGIGIWFLGGRSAEAAPILSTPFALEKLSTDGQVYSAAISHDGKTVVYSHRNAGKEGLWVTQLDTSENTEIVPPSDFVYYGLVLSPDDKFIYFSRGQSSGREQQPAIYRESIFGGVPQRIISEAQGWIGLSPDGEKLSFVRCPHEPQEHCSLWMADSLDGRNERKLVTRPRPIRIGDNEISPDGKTIAFTVGQSRTSSNEFGLAEVDIESGVEREITSEKFINIKHAVWLPGQKELLITARRYPDKNFRIWRVSAYTGNVSALTDDSKSYSVLSLNEDGSALVSSQVEADFRLNVYAVEDPESRRIGLAVASSVNFAPNGKIVFASARTGNLEIWNIKQDGSDGHQLTHDASDDTVPVVSADNNLIFFASNRTGNVQIWKMNADGSNQTQVTRAEGGNPLLVSRDGRWLYYKSAIQKTIRRVSIHDGQEELIFDKTNPDSALSPDGQQVALSERKNGENMLAVVSVANGRVTETYKYADGQASLVCLVWSNDGKYLAYVLNDESENLRTLWFQPLDNERPRKVADLGEDEVFELSGLALSPDDKNFAVIQGSWSHDAVLIKGLRQ